MESTLLSHHRILPLQNKEVGCLARKWQSSFYGKVMFNSSLLGRNMRSGNRSGLVISSVLGKKVKKETVVPDPDYRIPIVLLGWSGGLIYVDNLVAAVPLGLLGLLLLVQATRVRFVFNEEALILGLALTTLSLSLGFSIVDGNGSSWLIQKEVKIGEELDESGENVFVGGKNRWKYSTFVNWELWWPNFPILVYFKETQTKPEGQIHFFPVIFNGKQLYDVMVERCGPSQTSAPKGS